MNEIGMQLDESSDNSVYHNNFIDNVGQVETAGAVNVWDNGYPSGGNFWSIYTDLDLDRDGICDTPYNIDSNNTDRYPFMGPFSAFDAGTWNEIPYNVDIVSNSTVSDFYFNPEEGAFIWFNVTGKSGKTGFCRVSVPKDLLWVEDGWTIVVGGEPVTYNMVQDGNYAYLYFTYNHSTRTVQIIGTHVIPEFPASTTLLMTLIFMALIIIGKERLRRKP